MNTANSRFRINALIQMARTTENLDKRERYIAQAEEELEEMKSGKCQSSPLEIFLYEKCDAGEDFRENRTEIYKKYIEFCKERKFTVSSRNALYYFLRENGIGEVKSTGENFFKMKVL